MLQSLADTTDGSLRVGYPYFETLEPMVFDESGTYTDVEAPDATPIASTRTYEWNHGLGEVITALLTRGFVLRVRSRSTTVSSGRCFRTWSRRTGSTSCRWSSGPWCR